MAGFRIFGAGYEIFMHYEVLGQILKAQPFLAKNLVIYEVSPQLSQVSPK